MGIVIGSVLIVVAFGYFYNLEVKLRRASKSIKQFLESDDVLESIKESKIGLLGYNYSKTIVYKTTDGEKSNMPASEYINDESICKYYQVNQRLLDAASGTLVGLGLLGTFLGLTLGIKDFDSTNAAKINESIQGLLAGMGTAFITSLAGMSLSILFTFIDKYYRSIFYENVRSLTESLDSRYYIGDVELVVMNINEQTSNLVNKLTYTNEQGLNVTIGNAVRELLKESMEQTTALKSFSTDLAMALDPVDKALSSHMEKIMKQLVTIVEHIDKMADKVSSPASDMINEVVEELKKSMEAIASDFRSGLSGSTKKELEMIAAQMGEASKSMAMFPKNMETVSSTLNDTNERTKKLLDSFNTGVERLKVLNENILGTISGFEQAHGKISESTSNLCAISNDMKNATEMFNKGQTEYAAKLNDLHENSQKSIDQIQEILKSSGQLSEEYAQKFEVIKSGLSSIFAQLQNGLTEYSETVKVTTNQYLEDYTTSLTQTTSALASAIQQQNDITETLTETISRIKR